MREKPSIFIIAEAGVNHNGELATAKKLIDVAVKANVNAVKFQTLNAKNMVSKTLEKAKYQKETSGAEESQFDMLRRLELSKSDHEELIAYCKKKSIAFLSTAFDLESLDYLNSLNLQYIKVPSGEITNLPYLRKVGTFNRNVILSTGMASLGEIEKALEIMIDAGTTIEKITVLHANTEYPTPMQDVNLNAMVSIGKAFNVKVGYSDHTRGIEVPIAAVAMGASMIEKHFTLDNTMEGPDHKASLEPNELIAMTQSIRNIEQALGDGVKKCSQSEKKNKDIVRKCIVAKTEIKRGDLLNQNNLCVKRTGKGISAMRWDEFIGKKATQNYAADESLAT
jgi:N,N'-diacetyllegionaminate synthase